MEFGLNDSQRLFDDAVRGFLRTNAPIELVRRVAQEGTGFDDKLWQALVSLGLTGGLVPEAQGGSGTGLFDAALAAEALGYAAAPAPYVGPLVMAPLALRGLPESNTRGALLDGIAKGTVRFGVAEAGSDMSLQGERVTGTVEGGVDLAGATHLLLLASGGRIALVAVDGDKARAALEPTLDRTRPLGTVTLQDAPAELHDIGADGVVRVRDAGRVMLAADTLGAAQCMLDRAVAYSGERQQFGRLIGSFQAVKHMCAEMTAMLEPCRALVWYAAHAQDALPEEARLVACHAKAHLAETGRDVARMATEVHGGMGFTDLLGLHYWFKRIGFNRQVLGSPESLRREAAALQGWEDRTARVPRAQDARETRAVQT
jgi:alkylation response protein AidB-like acyl-CoA dehydrogenase